MLPKIFNGKDKTFFFFNWESGFSASGNTPTQNIVPSDAYRAGHLSALKDAKGNAIAIEVAGNKIPTSRLSFQSLTFLQFEPTANFSNGPFNFLSTRYSAVSHQHNYTTRIDQNFSAKDILTGRYTFNNTYEAGTPFWGHDERNNLGRTQNVALTYTRIVSPGIVNELRGGWHRFNEAEVFGTTNDPNYDVVGKMKLPLVSRLPEEFGPPSISISGADGGYSIYNCNRQSFGDYDGGYPVGREAVLLGLRDGASISYFGSSKTILVSEPNFL